MTAVKVGAALMLSVNLAPAQFGWFHTDSSAARKSAKKQPARKAYGEDGVLCVVTRMAPGSFVAVTEDRRAITYRIADTTLYFHGTRWVSPTQLQRGAVVRVEANADRDGMLTANAVVFQDVSPVMKPRLQTSDLLPGGAKDDPLIQQAREALDSFFGMLPNFLCQQSTTRAYSGSDKHWRTVDQVTAEVMYDHGHESYRDVKLNGRITGRSMMDLPGSKSTGEFASTLRALFAIETGALFKFHGNGSLSGFSTAVYEFAVSGDHSDWHIIAGSQMILASYTGRIWIERKSGNVVRIEMKAVDIPAAFPFQRVEAAVDYGPVVLPAGRYFLPERAENVSCNDPKSCSRNVIEFRNYHKYIGESSISFDVPEPGDPPADPRQ